MTVFLNKRLFCTLALIFATLTGHSTPEKTAVVSYVIDGDTFITETRERVRLLNINSPELAHETGKHEPYAAEARDALRAYLTGKKVTLKFDANPKDRYGRLLAHVYLDDGTWVNQWMIEQGLAHVYTFPENTRDVQPLMATEDRARAAQKGLWQSPRYRIFSALESEALLPHVDDFVLVQGQVLQVNHVKNRTYLNFDQNWRTDFTVEILDKHLAAFKGSPLLPFEALQGKTVRVRGIIKPVNGTLMTVTHPEQLTLLD